MMYFYIYWDGHFVGTVVARTIEDARLRAEEKFGPIWGFVEVLPYRKARKIAA